MIEAPKFDDRTAADIAATVPVLLRQRRLAKDSANGRFDAALIQVFARFSELVIERLNKAPEKNFSRFSIFWEFRHWALRPPVCLSPSLWRQERRITRSFQQEPRSLLRRANRVRNP